MIQIHFRVGLLYFFNFFFASTVRFIVHCGDLNCILISEVGSLIGFTHILTDFPRVVKDFEFSDLEPVLLARCRHSCVIRKVLLLHSTFL